MIIWIGGTSQYGSVPCHLKKVSFLPPNASRRKGVYKNAMYPLGQLLGIVRLVRTS